MVRRTHYQIQRDALNNVRKHEALPESQGTQRPLSGGLAEFKFMLDEDQRTFILTYILRPLYSLRNIGHRQKPSIPSGLVPFDLVAAMTAPQP